MKKVVLKLDVHDERCKQKAMRKVSTVPGLDSISMDMKEKKLTLTGNVDPVEIVDKLRKLYHTEIISVGPLKEPEKKKEDPQKPVVQPKKVQAQKDQTLTAGIVHGFYNPQYPYPYSYSYPQQYTTSRSVEEDPNACIIC